MFNDLPLALIALTVWTYWATVLSMVVYKRLRHGRHSGVIPRQRFERRLWFVLLPTVGASLYLPLLAVLTQSPWLLPPEWATTQPALTFRWAALTVGVLCYLGSLFCWASLGRSWSLGVVPKQDTALVTAGIYAWVRHPIYALNIGLMLMVATITLTVPMTLFALAHVVALNLKASHEERHLTERFGFSYEQYCHRVGRFFPQWSADQRQKAESAVGA